MKSLVLFSFIYLLGLPLQSFAEKTADGSSSIEQVRPQPAKAFSKITLTDTCTTKLKIKQAKSPLSCKLDERSEIGGLCKCRIPGTRVMTAGVLTEPSAPEVKVASLESLDRQTMIAACMKLYYAAPGAWAPAATSDLKLRLFCMEQIDSAR